MDFNEDLGAVVANCNIKQPLKHLLQEEGLKVKRGRIQAQLADGRFVCELVGINTDSTLLKGMNPQIMK